MGIHFACHHCNHALHVKDFQAGKRGKCPECKGVFRIPLSDASHSVALDANIELESISVVAEDEPTPQKLTPSHIKTQARNDVSLPSMAATTAASMSKISQPIDVSIPKSVLPPAPTSAASIPIALASASGAAWFVRPPTGGQFGPASSQLLWDWIVEKRVTFDSFLWREGMVQWQLANEVIPELFGRSKPPTVPPMHPGSNLPPMPVLPTAARTTVPAVSPAPPVDRATVSIAPPLPDTSVVPGPASTIEPAPIAPATVPSERPQVSTPSSLAKKKREQKRRKQLTAIIVLSVLSIILLVVLIAVLVMQSVGTPPATPPT